MTEKMLARVAVSSVPYAADRLYTYLVPDELIGSAEAGKRVTIPFGRGNRRVEGFLLEVGREAATSPLKPIDALLDDAPLLDAKDIRLVRWMKARYFCTYYDAIKTILPGGVWLQYRELWHVNGEISAEDALSSVAPDSLEETLLRAMLSAKEIERGALDELGGEKTAKALRSLEACGLAVRETKLRQRLQDKSVRMVSLCVSAEDALAAVEPKRRSAPVRYAVVELLSREGCLSSSEISYYTGATMQTLRGLKKAGLVEFSEREVLRVSRYDDAPAREDIVLNGEQQAAFDGLCTLLGREGGSAALLHGVTASGKTQVYIRLIEEALTRGKTAMLLVPEIALTPQLLGKLTGRFGEQVAVLHSSLQVGARFDEWRRIREGRARVVVGTRSAVFAPVENAGLFILDEEQEHTYKSENTPRYHAREVALYRGLRAGALVVFGSATPSVETMYHAKCGDFALYTLKERFNRQAMPRVELVDLKQELRQGNAGIVSTALEERLRDTVIRGDQAILFLNRRGNSRCLVCVDCGDAPSCPRCSVYLTYHSVTNRLMCHYCGYSEPVTERCPHCGGPLRPVGAGTQKVEEELRYEFPDTGILRMDADTVTAANSHEAILERFRRKEASILVGTQMVAKGLDFASVTLAGVLDADLSLYVNHYRAAETTFSLVTQLVGRSGRGADTGTAVIQTMCPEHPVLKLAAAQDYDGFYDMEIALRELRNVPPFRDLFTVTFTGLFEEHVRAAAKRFRDALAMNLRQSPYAGMEFDLLGPAPAAIAKVNYTYRYRATLSCKNTKEIRALLRFLLGAFAKDKQNKGVSAFVDVNAYD